MTHPEYISIGSPENRVIEEIGEVLQAIGKANRFGMENFHPERTNYTNRTELLAEIEDLINALLRYQRELVAEFKQKPDGL